MKPLGNIRTHDCAYCQGLCCVASGRTALPGKLSRAPAQACPNLTHIGDCVSCSVHETLAGDPAMMTCHLFDCLGLGNRLSDIMKKSGVHWMKDAPLAAEKQVVFDNVVYYFDIISTVLSFLARAKQAGLQNVHDMGMVHVEQMLSAIEADCQQGVSSRERLVDFWMGVILLKIKLPPQISAGYKMLENTQVLYDAVTRDVFEQTEQVQSGLSEQIAPVLREYAFAYATITLTEVATHGKKFEKSFHDRAVHQVCKRLQPEESGIYMAILNTLYRPITLGFQS